MAKQFRGNPLRNIPSAASIRKRLDDLEIHKRKLELLLDLAQRIEAEQTSDHESERSEFCVPETVGLPSVKFHGTNNR